MAENESGNAVPLEEVLVAFKKSLARATLASEKASKYDVQFLLGNRTLYNVGGLSLDLNVKVAVENKTGSENDQVLLDFNAEASQRSNVQFRVDTLPLEPIKGPKVVLARRNKNKEKGQLNEFKVWAVDHDGSTAEKTPIDIHIESVEFERDIQPISVVIKKYQTDYQGQLMFTIHTTDSTIEIREKKQDLIDESGAVFSFEGKKDWVIWVTQENIDAPSEILPLLVQESLKT